MQQLTINQETPFGFNISKDADGNISLTDLWKSAGCPESKRPNDWTSTDDNPNDYTNPANGEGWKLWGSDIRVNVIAYAVLPEPLASQYGGMSQTEFKSKFGYHPNFGCVGE